MAKSPKVRVELDLAYISRTVVPNATDMTAKRAALKTRDRARANLKAADRMRTGALYRSITARKDRSTGTRTTYTVSAGKGLPDDRAIFQERGIGPVHAKKGKVLRFQPKGSSVFIFRPRTKGFKGAFYMKRARDAIRLEDFLP